MCRSLFYITHELLHNGNTGNYRQGHVLLFRDLADLVYKSGAQQKVKEQPILTDIILEFAERQCSDVRDKVFALLSLASPRKYPAPDYIVFLGIIEEDFRWFSWSDR